MNPANRLPAIDEADSTSNTMHIVLVSESNSISKSTRLGPIMPDNP